MIKGVFVLLFVVLVACILRTPSDVDPVSLPALFPEISTSTNLSGKDATSHDSTAFAAIDRECGSCHHGAHSSNTRALEIFDLRDTCWHCSLTPEQGQSLKGRISGSAFTDTERTAIVALIAHLADDAGTTH